MRDVGILPWVPYVLEFHIDEIRGLTRGGALWVPVDVWVGGLRNPSPRDDATEIITGSDQEDLVVRLWLLRTRSPSMNNSPS